MAYDGKCLSRASDALRQRASAHESEYNERERRICELDSRIGVINIQLRRSMIGVINSALSANENIEEKVKSAQNENRRLRQHRGELLCELGYPADYLDRGPLCPLCGDTGYTEAGMCSCLKELYCRELVKSLSENTGFSKIGFSDFKPELYSDELRPGERTTVRENMLYNVHVCREFVLDPASRRSMFFSGAPGTGKSFLAAATAFELCDRGEYVIYVTAGMLFSCYEDDRFRRLEEARAEIRRWENCSVLIIDDLGTESASSQNAPSLYQLINTRAAANRRTILCAGFDPSELARRYSAPIASRISGEYKLLLFRGDDIRQSASLNFR